MFWAGVLLSRLDRFMSPSIYTISTDSNVSYDWRLTPGDTLRVAPRGRGAYVTCTPFTGITVHVGVGSGPAQLVTDSTIAGISFGAAEGYAELTVAKPVTTVVHIRFMDYRPGQTATAVQSGSALSIDPAASPDIRRESPATSKHPSKPQGSGAVLIVAASLAMAAVILGLIIAKRRIANHRNYEVMSISSDSDEFDAYIPAVVQRKEHIAAACPYVLCVMDGASVTSCNPSPTEILQ